MTELLIRIKVCVPGQHSFNMASGVSLCTSLVSLIRPQVKSSLSLHPLPSLISNYSEYPLELRAGHGWSLLPTNMKWEHRKASVARSPTWPCSASLSVIDSWARLLWTQGRPRRLQLFYKQEAGRGHGEKGLSQEGPLRSCLRYTSVSKYYGVRKTFPFSYYRYYSLTF